MIYLDHNSTTTLRPPVLSAMIPFLEGQTGNPASVHGFGRIARQGLDNARRQVGQLFGVHESLVCFTSGATEANNMAIFGIAGMQDKLGHVVTSRVEHPSALESFRSLERQGHRVTWLDVDGCGRVDPKTLEESLDNDTFLVSIMHANNETGVIQPIEIIGEICRKRGLFFHTDAAQSMGRILWNRKQMPADLVSISAHKMGGPKGVGGLIMDRSLALKALLVGGGQERGRRAGTENLPGIIGMGAVAQWLTDHQQEEINAMTRLRDHMETELLAKIPGLVVFSQKASRLPNTAMVGIAGIHGETLVMNLDLSGFAISSGAACASGKGAGSHVLTAMGVPPSLAMSAVRISVGWNTRMLELERFIQQFVHSVARLRGAESPVGQ